jgi:hypothetical protein
MVEFSRIREHALKLVYRFDRTGDLDTKVYEICHDLGNIVNIIKDLQNEVARLKKYRSLWLRNRRVRNCRLRRK